MYPRRGVYVAVYSVVTNTLTRIQLNFLGQAAASGCEGFPTFRELTSSSSSEWVGGLVAPKLVISPVPVAARSKA